MLEVAGPGRDTDFAPVLPHRARALEGEARAKRYAIGQNPPPPEVPVIEMTYQTRLVEIVVISTSKYPRPWRINLLLQRLAAGWA